MKQANHIYAAIKIYKHIQNINLLMPHLTAESRMHLKYFQLKLCHIIERENVCLIRMNHFGHAFQYALNYWLHNWKCKKLLSMQTLD